MRSCSIQGCIIKHYGRGMCSKHYRRWSRYRDPSIKKTASAIDPLEERLMTKKRIINGCWIYTGVARKDGYCVLSFKGKRSFIHRLAYEHFVGPIQDGLTMDHLCRNRACFNPLHLQAVTMRENILRGMNPAAINAKKTHCKNGHPLTPGNVYTGSKKFSRTCIVCSKARSLHARAQLGG